MIFGFKQKEITGRNLVAMKNATGSNSPIYIKQNSSTSVDHLITVPSQKSYTTILEANATIYFSKDIEVSAREIDPYCRFNFDILNESEIFKIPSRDHELDFSDGITLGDKELVTSQTTEQGVTELYLGHNAYNPDGSITKDHVYNLEHLQGYQYFELEFEYASDGNSVKPFAVIFDAPDYNSNSDDNNLRIDFGRLSYTIYTNHGSGNLVFGKNLSFVNMYRRVKITRDEGIIKVEAFELDGTQVHNEQYSYNGYGFKHAMLNFETASSQASVHYLKSIKTKLIN